MLSLPTLDALDGLTIPTACPVSWDSMRGDHRTRFCDQCKQNVHDVSELTRAEALRLVAAGPDVPCLRLYRRTDGRVMTADCATRRERVWKWLHRWSPWAAAAFGLVFLHGCNLFCYSGAVGRDDPRPSTDALQAAVGPAAVVAPETLVGLKHGGRGD